MNVDIQPTAEHCSVSIIADIYRHIYQWTFRAVFELIVDAKHNQLSKVFRERVQFFNFQLFSQRDFIQFAFKYLRLRYFHLKIYCIIINCSVLQQQSDIDFLI